MNCNSVTGAAIAVFAMLSFAGISSAQNYAPGTKIMGQYQGANGNPQDLTGTIAGKQLRMDKDYYVGGTPVHMTVAGQLEGKTLTYTINFDISGGTPCATTGTANVEVEIDHDVIKIPLDHMTPDDSMCRQPPNAAYRRTLTIELPLPPS